MSKLPVKTVLKIKPKSGLENNCLQWMKETAAVANSFSGFVSKEIYKLAEEENLFVNIFIFKSLEELQAWENSSERKEQTLKKILPKAVGAWVHY